MIKEASLLRRVNNHQNTLNSGNEESEEQTRNLSADGETATQQVLGRIFTVPSDSSRVIMFLNDADLKDRYLTGKGESKIATAATDEQLAAIFSHAQFQVDGDVNPDNSFVFLVDDFDLTAVDKTITSKRPYAVLFNVPKSAAAHLKSQAPTDIDDARKVLAEIISHKNYVAVLNASAIKKANVGALSDREEREELFNVKKFITAYPVRAVIDAAREEQEERDHQTRVTPTDSQDADTSAPTQTPLSKADLENAKKIAEDARKIFFMNSARGKWPTTAEGLKKLRNTLVHALTKDDRIGDNKRLIPAIVKFFYIPQVKQDPHYNDLLNLLKADANFMKLASGEVDDEETTEPAETTDGEAEPAADQPEEPAPAAAKSAQEIADEIKAQGDEYADQVAKILGRGAAANAPASEPEPELPPEVKAEIERLTKIKNNAINPAQRTKAATEIARLLHQEEEKRKQKKKRK